MTLLAICFSDGSFSNRVTFFNSKQTHIDVAENGPEVPSSETTKPGASVPQKFPYCPRRRLKFYLLRVPCSRIENECVDGFRYR